MLKDAGSEGVRSDAFVAAYMPRAAARIKELRDSGYKISSEHEKQFVRYRLESAGNGAGDTPLEGAQQRSDLCAPGAVSNASKLTGVPSQGGASESPPFRTHERAGEKAPPSQASPALQLFEPAQVEAA